MKKCGQHANLCVKERELVCENEAIFLHQNEINLLDGETKWLPTSICSAFICTGSPMQTKY